MDAAAIALCTARIQRAIEIHAFVRAGDAEIISRKGVPKTDGWLFDIRNMLMRSEIMDDLSALFWSKFAKSGPIQIGCIETAGIPLMAALVAHAEKFGIEGCSGFFIRKSRKKDGLARMVEGEVAKGRKIILVDDIVNSGKSLARQVEVVESLGMKVNAIWTIMRFRDSDYYDYFTKKGIPMHSLFTLDDFKKTLGTENFKDKEPPPPRTSYTVLWKFAAKNPSYFYVVPKSDPAIDREKIYIGTDSGVFYALNQSDGKIVWSYKVGFHPKGKGIFSSPALWNETVFFGAYDGNVYALDTMTGKKKWIFFEADWVGSSPALAHDLGLLFIGLEFGLWKKRGGIVALDAKTGKKVWEYRMPNFTHSSPLYIKEKKQVVVGSNDGVAYLFDAKNGDLVWKYETTQLQLQDFDTGFSDHDIKESFAYDTKRDLIAFGTSNGSLYVLDRKNGKEQFLFKAEFGIYSTPLVYQNLLLVSSLDKYLYCFDLNTFKEKWRWHAGARIFASPVIIEGKIYIGTNTGRLTELETGTGHELSSLTFTERITNKTVYNKTTKRFFVPTFANEIYCLERLT